jgi:hypothetical protein
MKGSGIALLIVGLLALALGLIMDTSVATGFGDTRVHNIGLLRQQQNLILVGIAVSILGVILLVFGRRSSASEGGRSLDASIDSHKTCPFCAEHIRKDAVVCRFCNRELPDSGAGEVPKPAVLSDEEVMAKLGITHDGAQYRFQTYKYDRLADAVRYAEKHAVSPN